MSTFCPHCGYNLAKLEAVEDGPFRYDPQRGFLVRGARLKAPNVLHEILGAIMLARGAIVKPEVLADRIGYEGDLISNHISVRLCQARKAVLEAGAYFPVKTVWGVGLSWELNAAPVKHVRPHRLAPMLEASA